MRLPLECRGIPPSNLFIWITLRPKKKKPHFSLLYFSYHVVLQDKTRLMELLTYQTVETEIKKRVKMKAKHIRSGGKNQARGTEDAADRSGVQD